jgi:hypothetical protein
MYLTDDDNKPLFTLSVAQYSRILRKIFAEEVERIVRVCLEEKNKNNQETDICNIDQVIEITKLAKSTLYSKVSKKHIPCLSRGKPLLFSRDHLHMWLKAGRPQTDSINAIKEILKEETA